MRDKIIVALVISVIGLITAFYIHNLRGDIKRIKEERTAAQKESRLCDLDRTLTEEVAYDYETDISNLNAQLANTRKLLANARCVPTVTGPDTSPDGTTAGEKLSGGDGINTGYLLDFAGRCEETRLKVKGLQSFINQTWQSRGINP